MHGHGDFCNVGAGLDHPYQKNRHKDKGLLFPGNGSRIDFEENLSCKGPVGCRDFCHCAQVQHHPDDLVGTDAQNAAIPKNRGMSAGLC